MGGMVRNVGATLLLIMLYELYCMCMGGRMGGIVRNVGATLLLMLYEMYVHGRNHGRNSKQSGCHAAAHAL